MFGNIFNHDYPYTDFHELNLDFILESIAEIKSKIGDSDLTTTAQTITGAINELKAGITSLISSKQNKLTAGANITLTSDTISATDTTYTAGSNVSISASNVISATDTTYTAGSGISITDGVISATGGGGGAPITELTANFTWASEGENQKGTATLTLPDGYTFDNTQIIGYKYKYRANGADYVQYLSDADIVSDGNTFSILNHKFIQHELFSTITYSIVTNVLPSTYFDNFSARVLITHT